MEGSLPTSRRWGCPEPTNPLLCCVPWTEWSPEPSIPECHTMSMFCPWFSWQNQNLLFSSVRPCNATRLIFSVKTSGSWLTLKQEFPNTSNNCLTEAARFYWNLSETSDDDHSSCSPVQQQILWFQVSVDDGQTVEIVQSTHDLRRVEECCGVVESSSAAKVTEQLSSADVGKQHVEKALVLGTPAQIHQEGMIDLLEMTIWKSEYNAAGNSKSIVCSISRRGLSCFKHFLLKGLGC